MKNRLNKIIKHRAMGTGICLLALSALGTPVVSAQEAADSVAVRRIAKTKKAVNYEMKNVTGRIVDDATGEPMGGVRIQALGLESFSTLTEEDGTYKLDIPTFSDVLYVYAEGYNPLQVVVKENKADGKLISGNFKPTFTDGTNITANRTITVDESSSITVDTEIENHLAADIYSVSRNGVPGQGAFMQIRGVNSINANTQPMIILDGNIIDPQYDRTTLHQGFYNNLIASIDPENIESVQVLKNGTALYGAKGANGVIIITTKRGKSQATKIGVRIYGGVELTPKKLDMLNGPQYNSYLSDMLSTKDNFNISSLNAMTFLDKSPSNYYRKVFDNNTDWQKDMYENAMTQNYKINVEGGDDIGMYALSLGYTKSESTGVGIGMDRLNLRFNTDIKVFKNLTTGLDIAYNQTSYDLMDQGWSDDYSMQNIGALNVLGLISAPFLSPYAYYHNYESTAPVVSDRLELSREYAGKYAATSSNWIQNPFQFPRQVGINEALRNPYWVVRNGDGNNKNYAQLTQIHLNVSPKWQITKQFSISDRFNYTMSRNNEKYFLPIAGTNPYQLTDLGNITSVLKTQFSKETTLNNDLRLQWGNIYGAHAINVMGGWRYNNYQFSYNSMRGYNNENDKLPNLSKDMQFINYNGTNDNWIDMTYYLDASYNFKNRYFADFTISSQSSSRFGDSTKSGFQACGVSWGVFPSLQLGWLISSEPWFKTGKGVQYLKLTAGVEQNGNDDVVDYYAARTYWESLQVTQNTVGLYLKNIENSTIQWETTTKYNVGLEGSFLNNRLHAGLDLYWHKTDDLLTLKELSYISGMNKYWTNEGAMTNKGFEVSVNAALINKKNWKWELGATVGHYNNEITDLPSTQNNQIDVYKNVYNPQTDSWSSVQTGTIHGYTTGVYGNENILTAVGHSVGSFYGWQTNGVFADDKAASSATTAPGTDGYLLYPTGLKENPYKKFQAGDVRFVDQNGDGVIDNADKVVLGNPNPDIYGNIYTSLTWKDLRLDVNFKYSLGNDIFNYQRSVIEGLNTTYNQSTAALRRWTYEGQHTDMPRACYNDSEDWRNNERFSDRWIEDGSYLKLKNVRLTYKIPYSNTWLLGLKVWGEANNVFTITKYLGTDPEMSSNNATLYRGVDNGQIPYGRSFNVGVSINL